MCLSRQQLEGEHAEFLKTHVTGVLSHGHNLAWAFIDLLRWPADANRTINILFTVLRDIVHQVCKKMFLRCGSCFCMVSIRALIEGTFVLMNVCFHFSFFWGRLGVFLKFFFGKWTIASRTVKTFISWVFLSYGRGF